MDSTVRKEKYKYYIKRYSIYPILLLLQEYENEEHFTECAIISSALKEFYASVHPKPKVKFPVNLSQYRSDYYQDYLKSEKIKVNESKAKSEVKTIKYKLPIQ